MKYVLSNWKMYPSRNDALDLLRAVQAGLGERDQGGEVEVILCPPFISLEAAHAAHDPQLVSLGAQNCHEELAGPYTGEISVRMLEGLVDYVLIGHSERRAAGETDEQIARRVATVTEAGVVPILFVGEDEPTEDALEQTERRLAYGLGRVDLATVEVVVVYEPTWAIGADRPAHAVHVEDVVAQLKARLRELGSPDPRVIYGGTVNARNVDQFAALAVLDGVGATRAGLAPDEFLRIVDRLAAAGAG